jgi:hypothetical protein
MRFGGGSQQPRGLKSRPKSCSGKSRIKEYNDNTSLHGPKYITEDHRYTFERFKNKTEKASSHYISREHV